MQNPPTIESQDNPHTHCIFTPIILIVSTTHQTDGVFHEVPHFASSVYKSSKHVGLSFAYDAPKIWNNLPDDICSTTSLHSFRKKLKTYLFAQAYPP